MSSDQVLATASPPRRARWALVAVLLACTTTSYIDRIAISVLGPTLRGEFGMTNSEYAFVVNCFMVTYMIMYSVGGRLADLLGFRRAMSLYVVWWSITGSMHALSVGFRSLAVGIVNFGSSLGSALTVPLVGWLAVTYGWRTAFLTTGLMGFALLPFWLAITGKHRQEAEEPTTAKTIPWLQVVRYRQAWSVFMGRLISAGAWGFYAFWIPEYLTRARGLDLTQIGTMA